MASRTEPLDVWLYGMRVAQLAQPSDRVRYRLDFTEEALDTYGEGLRVLSLALPVSRAPVADDAGGLPVTNFLDGLLPEGNLRQHLAVTEGVATTDLMALLRAVGADCAGAVQFLRPGADPAGQTIRELTEEQVTRLVADLPTYHLPDGVYPQASLAGLQDKVLLVDLGGGRWGWPENGAASTHIVKPAPARGVIPHLVEAEDWSLRVARRAGLPAAESRLQRFHHRDAIVVSRYDRGAAGARIHQEDFCQALGLPPNAKYESTTETRALASRLSRLMAIAAPQAKNDPTDLRRALLSAVTYNVVTGNGDAHSKNYSLLLGPRGEVSLAPLYDTAPIMFVDPSFQNTGHVINGHTGIGTVETDDLVDEARTWGLPQRLARQTVADVIDRTRSAIADTAAPKVLEQMLSRLDEFWRRKSWAVAQRHPVPAPDSPVTVSGYTTRRGKTVRSHTRVRPEQQG